MILGYNCFYVDWDLLTNVSNVYSDTLQLCSAEKEKCNGDRPNDRELITCNLYYITMSNVRTQTDGPTREIC